MTSPTPTMRETIEELLAALRLFTQDERFQVWVGGNPIAVNRMLDEANAAIARAERALKDSGGKETP